VALVPVLIVSTPYTYVPLVGLLGLSGMVIFYTPCFKESDSLENSTLNERWIGVIVEAGVLVGITHRRVQLISKLDHTK